MNQRWLARVSTFRPESERIRTAEYDVAAIADDRTGSSPYPKARAA